MESRGGIYKQTICECLLQKRVCLRPSESARSCHQENATSLFPAVCSSSPQVLQTLSSWFCFSFCSPRPFLGNFCVAFGKERGEGDPPAGRISRPAWGLETTFFSLLLSVNVCVPVPLNPTDCLASSLLRLSGRRSTRCTALETWVTIGRTLPMICGSLRSLCIAGGFHAWGLG